MACVCVCDHVSESVKCRFSKCRFSVLNLKFDSISDGGCTREKQIQKALGSLPPCGNRCRFSESAICSSRVHLPSEIKSNFKFKTLRWRPLRWRLTLSECERASSAQPGMSHRTRMISTEEHCTIVFEIITFHSTQHAGRPTGYGAIPQQGWTLGDERVSHVQSHEITATEQANKNESKVRKKNHYISTSITTKLCNFNCSKLLNISEVNFFSVNAFCNKNKETVTVMQIYLTDP